MQKYEAIEKGIVEDDISALREAVGSICYTNRDFSSGEFDEVVRYIESKGIKIKDDELKGARPVSESKSDFSDEDFARAVFELKRNFCNERIHDVKKIGRALYSKKENKVTASKKEKTGTNPNAQSHQKKNNIWIPIFILVALTILTILVMK